MKKTDEKIYLVTLMDSGEICGDMPDGFAPMSIEVSWRLRDYTLYITEELVMKRCELFRQGHILWVVAYKHKQTKTLWATDAWFCRDPEAY